MVRDDLNDSVQIDNNVETKKDNFKKEIFNNGNHSQSSSMTALEFIASFKQQQTLYEEKCISSLLHEKQANIMSSKSHSHQNAMICTSGSPLDQTENLASHLRPKNDRSTLSAFFVNKIDNFENNNDYCSKERYFNSAIINENGVLFNFF